MPTFGSLFSGIGGIDLGLERAGWECRWQVEIDQYCNRVLAAHWPDVPRYGDIRSLDAAALEPVDLIAGGFPCQPVSVAGRRAGVEDERWLWPDFGRIVRVLRPRFVLLENVPGLASSGLIGDVLGALAECGYDAEWDRIPASAVGAPHLRNRIYIVASRPELGRPLADASRGGLRDQEPTLRPGRDAAGAGGEPVADAEGWGRQVEWLAQPAGVEGARGGETDGRGAVRQLDDAAVADAAGEGLEVGERLGGDVAEELAPAQRGGEVADAAGAGRDGARPIFAAAAGGAGARSLAARSGWWATEPDVGRVAHGVPARVDRLRALGNAVVPQVAEWIGRRLMETL